MAPEAGADLDRRALEGRSEGRVHPVGGAGPVQALGAVGGPADAIDALQLHLRPAALVVAAGRLQGLADVVFLILAGD